VDNRREHPPASGFAMGDGFRAARVRRAFRKLGFVSQIGTLTVMVADPMEMDAPGA
jgi:hypothetical protein